jgi:hypothetical protein
MKTIEEALAELSDVPDIFEADLYEAEEYLKAHPEERGTGEPLLDWYKRVTSERKKKKPTR